LRVHEAVIPAISDGTPGARRHLSTAGNLASRGGKTREIYSRMRVRHRDDAARYATFGPFTRSED